jgi:hypothetical protein
VTVLPGAIWRGPIPNRTPGGIRRPCLGVVEHITGSTFSAADGWFHNPSAQASAHLIIDYDGTTYQEVAFDDKAWAEAAGNPNYYSIETVGISTTEPLTNAQVASFARAYRFLADLDGLPYALAEAPGQRGLGWHGMGGNSWGGHPYCPGEPRKAQRPLILQLAQGGAPTPPQEVDMPTSWEVKIAPGERRPISIPPPFEGAVGWKACFASIGADTLGGPPIPARVAAGHPGGWYAPGPAGPADPTQVHIGTGREFQWQLKKGDKIVSIINEAAPYDPAHPELGPNLSFLFEAA